VNAHRVPAALAESLMSGVNALAEQTPVCLPSVPVPTPVATPAAAPPPAHHEHPHEHGPGPKPHHDKHGKHGGEGD